MTPSITAIVVAYEPEATFFSLVEIISRQVESLIIVKNSKIPKYDFPKNVNVIGEEKNLGLGAGLNLGLNFGISQGTKWILIFDQDSSPSDSFVSQTFASLNNYSPKILDEDFVFGAEFSETSVDFSQVQVTEVYPVVSVFSSGTLFPVSVVKKIGLLNEKFFIDQVDHEFCLRARERGIPILKGKLPFFKHQVGNPVPQKVLFWLMHPTHQNSKRWFFGARNLVWNFKLHGPRPLRFFCREFYSQVNRVIKVWLLETEKFEKTFSFLRGLIIGALRPAPHAPLLDSRQPTLSPLKKEN